MTIAKLPAKWPVIEIFGPTIQGEGVDQGVVCHFVRFGGCDFKCFWCDTPYAVLPHEVRKNATKMNSGDIITELINMSKAPWVILSGGNPALHDLTTLVDDLHSEGFLVAVETQGSRWRDWMRKVDRLCVSPKPPSSGMVNEGHQSDLSRFLHEGMAARADGVKPYEWLFLKVVCFTDEDLDWAELIRSQLSDAMLFLSTGNDSGRTIQHPDREDDRTMEQVRMDLLDKARWLTEEVLKRESLCGEDVFVQAQFHTLLWGNGQGF